MNCITRFLFLLFFLVTTLACTQDIRIGAILPLSGDAASWGELGKEGLQLALDEINAKDGIHGKKVAVIYEDTQAQPEKGASAMLKLATVNKVPAVIGDIVSSTTLAASPIAEKNKVVLLSPTASAPKITEAGKYIFRIWPSDLAEGTAIAEFAIKTLKVKNVAILYIQNDYGISLQKVFEKNFSKFGGKVLLSMAYKVDETNFRPYLTKIKAKNPEAIYLVSYYKDAGLILKQAKQLKIDSQFLGTTAIEEPKLFEIAGDSADGVIYPISSGYDPNNKVTVVTKFIKDFKKRYDKEPGFIQAQTYDALKLIALAIEKSGSTGPAIQKYLETIKDYHGVTGLISFDENGDVKKPTQIKIIKGNRFIAYTEGIK